LERLHLKPFRARDGNVLEEGKLDRSKERHFGKGVRMGDCLYVSYTQIRFEKLE
jgi:hypothetical protein